MVTISLCMIVKNEEVVLDRCLSSVCEICDEIIIVDTGSTDKTKEIAKKYTDKIYDFKWVDDFSKARNYSFSKATKDYILWLDADDIVPQISVKKLLELKNKCEKEIDIFMFKYDIMFDENGNSTYSYYRERLLKRENNYVWLDPVHECIQLNGKIEYHDISIEHRKTKQGYSKRNLKIYEKLIAEGKTLSVRQEFYYARELYFNNKIKKAIFQFNKFLKNKDAWIENKVSASLDLSNCYSVLKMPEKAIEVLLNIFKFTPPRSEVLCAIGKNLQILNKYQDAICWYEIALTIKPKLESGGFYDLDSYGYIPCIELCVCYYKIGDLKKAKYYNDLAGRFKPNDSSFLHNKNFFKNVQ